MSHCVEPFYSLWVIFFCTQCIPIQTTWIAWLSWIYSHRWTPVWSLGSEYWLKKNIMWRTVLEERQLLQYHIEFGFLFETNFNQANISKLHVEYFFFLSFHICIYIFLSLVSCCSLSCDSWPKHKFWVKNSSKFFLHPLAAETGSSLWYTGKGRLSVIFKIEIPVWVLNLPFCPIWVCCCSRKFSYTPLFPEFHLNLEGERDGRGGKG